MVKICLIDDDQTMTLLLKTILGLEGYEVLSLGDRGQCDQMLVVLRQELPALALIDVNLQAIDGFDLLDDIRRDPALDSMRVIMSSGMDFQEKSLQVGADGFLLKPYMPDDLLEKIKKLLGPGS
ncbi:MAG: response regulator [Anaerolineales bacterium]|jgi:DNA-binding response OmpR family regulator